MDILLILRCNNLNKTRHRKRPLLKYRTLGWKVFQKTWPIYDYDILQMLKNFNSSSLQTSKAIVWFKSKQDWANGRSFRCKIGLFRWSMSQILPCLHQMLQNDYQPNALSKRYLWWIKVLWSLKCGFLWCVTIKICGGRTIKFLCRFKF